MFENRYTITEKIYVDWTEHPVALGRARRRFPILLTLLAAACAVMLVIAFLDGNGTYACLYALLLAGGTFTAALLCWIFLPRSILCVHFV